MVWERKCEEEWRLKEKTGWWEEKKKRGSAGGKGKQVYTAERRKREEEEERKRRYGNTEESQSPSGGKNSNMKDLGRKKLHKKSTFQLLMSYRSRRYSADLQYVNIWRIIGV